VSNESNELIVPTDRIVRTGRIDLIVRTVPIVRIARLRFPALSARG